MRMIVVSASRKASSLGLATSLAAVIGALARRATLLVDFGTRPEQLRQLLGIDGPKSLESLVDQFMRTRTFGAKDIREQTIPYQAPVKPGLWGRGFDVLAGPAELTDGYHYRLVAQRGEQFAKMLVERCRELPYEAIIVDLGHAIFKLRSEPFVAAADLFVWCQETTEDYYWRKSEYRQSFLNQCIMERKRPLPTRPDGAIQEVVPETKYAFPDERFQEPLEKRSREYEHAASRLALYFADKLMPSIASDLKGLDGKQLRPRRGPWPKLLG